MSDNGNIDVTIPGSVSSVDNAARYLENLRDDASDGSGMLNRNAVTSGMGGETALAVGAYASSLRDAGNDIYTRAKAAAVVFRSFADQLSYRKDDMKQHLETARQSNLTVKGNIIEYPATVSPPGEFPKNGTSEQKNDWYKADDSYGEYTAKVRDFEMIRGRVEATFKKLNDWITENLIKAKTDALNDTEMGAVRDFVLGASGKAGELVLENKYTKAGDALRGQATVLARELAAKRSENKSVRTKSRPPSDKAVARNMGRGKPNTLSDTADGLEYVGGLMKKLAGPSLTLATAAYDLYNGQSPSKVVITTATSLATDAGVVVAAAALAPEASALAVGATAVAVGTVVVTGVGYAYEYAVPQNIRGKIDHFIEEQGELNLEEWEDVKNEVHDGWDWASRKLSHGWKSVVG